MWPCWMKPRAPSAHTDSPQRWHLWGIYCTTCVIVKSVCTDQARIRWNVQIPHLIHAWWCKRGPLGDVDLICLTNHPIGRLIRDLWTCEFSSWLIRARTFTWPPLSLYGNVIHTDQTGVCVGAQGHHPAASLCSKWNWWRRTTGIWLHLKQLWIQWLHQFDLVLKIPAD